MCDTSDSTRIAMAVLVVYGIPLLLSLVSRFAPEKWFAWAKTLQRDASNIYLVEKREHYLAMANASATVFTKTASEMKKRAATLGSSPSRGEDDAFSAVDENPILAKSAAMEYFRRLLRQKRHYWGLPDSLFPEGVVNTRFKQFFFPAGFLEDFLFYSCNTNTLLGGVLAHPDHPVTPRSHRVIFAVTQSLGLYLYVSVLTKLDGIVAYSVNFLVVIPVTVLLDRLVFYFVGCPCLHDAHHGSQSFQQAAKAARITSNLLILPFFLISLTFTLLAAYSAEYACDMLEYIWSNLLLVAVLDAVKSLPRFSLGMPFGFMMFDTVIVNTGDWLLERAQERQFRPHHPIPDPGEKVDRLFKVCCCGCCCCDCQVVSFGRFLDDGAETNHQWRADVEIGELDNSVNSGQGQLEAEALSAASVVFTKDGIEPSQA